MKSVCCDALGTLIDISAITTQLEQQYPGQGIRIADLWRTKQVDYSRLRALGGQYKPFGKITQDALEATFLELRIVYSPHDLDTAMGQYLSGVAFPDARNFLDALQVPWSILTNGDRDFIRPILNNAGIDCPDTHLLTSDQVETFKVDQRMYELTWSWAQRTGTTLKSDVIFISANQWDAIAASWFGFTTCWINRTGQSPEKLGASPLCEVSSMSGNCQPRGSQLVIEAIATGFALGLGSGVAPGPLTGLTISTTMRSGIGAGLRIAVAPLISDTIIIALSLTLVAQLPQTAISILGIIGAVVVAYFGIEILTSARKAQTPAAGTAKVPHRLDRFPVVLQGAAINFLNPAPWIFWVTAGSTLLVGFWRESPISAIAFTVVFYVLLVGVKVAIVMSLAATRHKMSTRTYRGILFASGILLLVAAALLLITHVL